MRLRDTLRTVVIVAALLEATVVDGCPVCIGDPGSPLTAGSNAGIAFLLAAVTVLTAGFAAVFVRWHRREKGQG